jgi:hypothetical protein
VADRFDVAARLAEGQPAVDHVQTYVRACHQLGYQHPDLTAHGSQVRDWYDTEAGLDLRVLDDDSAELRAAVTTLEEALWLQRMQVTEIATAWAGLGADSATRFLQRHCDVAAELAADVRAAADGYAALRDNLWQLVDHKAATAVAIDDRRTGERSAWLAAAQEVTAGSGDRSAAEEIVREHVMPYVDNDIRGDWLAAMRATTTSVEAAYDTTVDALSSMRELRFEIPGELGPRWQPVFDVPLAPSTAAATTPPAATAPDSVPTVPAGAPAPVSAAPAPVSATPAPVSAAPAPAPQPPPALPGLTDPLNDGAGLAAGTGGLGSSGGLGGSIGGIVGKIVDGIGGLLGSLADGFSDPSGIEDPLSDDRLDADDPLGDDIDDETDADDDDDTDDDDDDAQAAGHEATDEDVVPEETAQNPSTASGSGDEPVADELTSPLEPAPPQDTPPPDAPPPPEQTDGSTPCEIAADELPQAGQ